MKPTRFKLGEDKMADSDKVQVYCRVRPAFGEVCMRVLSKSVVAMVPPAAKNSQKETQYMFREVFTSDSNQVSVFQAVGQPLIDSLIKGQSALLFAYGVSGGGKTYTMTGNETSAGVMPRTINLLFKSIGNRQVEKYRFKPDHMNGFEVQTHEDAMHDLRTAITLKRSNTHLVKKVASTPGSSETSLASIADSEAGTVDSVSDDVAYAVFVSYVEIYNNTVYDLLDDSNAKTLSNKILREDSNRNMYVHAVTEIEAKTPTEALDLFYKGQKRKRVSHTRLNAESSRSHSIFTIRLVQVPVEQIQRNVALPSNYVRVSQLSLVDLAGSERANRAQTNQKQLKEASKINNSLLTLKSCLEILRENQLNGNARLVPYRESRLTHLFKSYFEGMGQVRMIVCVNPSVNDYDETVQVMKFAEMSQDVQVPMQTPAKIPSTPYRLPLQTPSGKASHKRKIHENGGLSVKARKLSDENIIVTADVHCANNGKTPSNRKVNEPRSKKTAERSGNVSANASLFVDGDFVYTLDVLEPEMVDDFNLDPFDDSFFLSYRTYAEMRQTQMIDYRDKLLNPRVESFRKRLNELEMNTWESKNELHTAQLHLETCMNNAKTLEAKIIALEKERDQAEREAAAKNDEMYQLKMDLMEKETRIKVMRHDMDRQKKTHEEKIELEKDKMERKLREQRKNLKMTVKDKENKLRLVQQIVGDDVKMNMDTESQSSDEPRSGNKCDRTIDKPSKTNGSNTYVKDEYVHPTPSKHQTPKKTPRRNPIMTVEKMDRKRRSRSVGPCPDATEKIRDEIWLEHRANLATPFTTVLQPNMRSKTVTKMTDAKDVTKSHASKYCLITKDLDTDGEMETCVYKGDVVPTTGGGAQVIFNDMEKLKQASPTARRRERSDGVNKKIY